MDFVELGGFTRHSDLIPDQRRHMYAQERGNLIASRTMGSQRYLNVIRQSNQGIAGGEDTDEHIQDLESESDPSANDLLSKCLWMQQQLRTLSS